MTWIFADAPHIDDEAVTRAACPDCGQAKGRKCMDGGYLAASPCPDRLALIPPAESANIRRRFLEVRYFGSSAEALRAALHRAGLDPAPTASPTPSSA